MVCVWLPLPPLKQHACSSLHSGIIPSIQFPLYCPGVLSVTENLQALQKGEKEVNINTLAHEAPSWMVFQLKELAVTEHVLKSVTVHQCKLQDTKL